MTSPITYDTRTATVNVATLGFPEATGHVVFAVSAYSGDRPRLMLKGTDLRLGKSTEYTVELSNVDPETVLEGTETIGRYGMHPHATASRRSALEHIQERLRDVALAALSTVVQDPGFAAWFLAAHIETLRSGVISDLQRNVATAKVHLADCEQELQSCEDLIAAAGPLTNEQLRMALAIARSNHSLGLAIEAARKI